MERLNCSLINVSVVIGCFSVVYVCLLLFLFIWLPFGELKMDIVMAMTWPLDETAVDGWHLARPCRCGPILTLQ